MNTTRIILGPKTRFCDMSSLKERRRIWRGLTPTSLAEMLRKEAAPMASLKKDTDGLPAVRKKWYHLAKRAIDAANASGHEGKPRPAVLAHA